MSTRTSCCSQSAIPTKRITDARSGKIRTTSVRRRISCSAVGAAHRIGVCSHQPLGEDLHHLPQLSRHLLPQPATDLVEDDGGRLVQRPSGRSYTVPADVERVLRLRCRIVHTGHTCLYRVLLYRSLFCSSVRGQLSSRAGWPLGRISAVS